MVSIVFLLDYPYLYESLALIKRNYHTPISCPPKNTESKETRWKMHVYQPENHVFVSCVCLFVGVFFKAGLSSSFQISLWVWEKNQLFSSFGDGSLLKLTVLTNNDCLLKDTVKWGMVFQNLQSTDKAGNANPEHIEERELKLHLKWNLEEKTSVEKGIAKENAC